MEPDAALRPPTSEGRQVPSAPEQPAEEPVRLPPPPALEDEALLRSISRVSTMTIPAALLSEKPGAEIPPSPGRTLDFRLEDSNFMVLSNDFDFGADDILIVASCSGNAARGDTCANPCPARSSSTGLATTDEASVTALLPIPGRKTLE